MTDNTVKIIDLIKEQESIKVMLESTITLQKTQIKDSDKSICIYKEWLRDIVSKANSDDATEIAQFAKSQNITL